MAEAALSTRNRGSFALHKRFNTRNSALGGCALRTENRQQVAIGIEDVGSPHGSRDRYRLSLERNSLVLECVVRGANVLDGKHDLRGAGHMFGRACPIFAQDQCNFARVEEGKTSELLR